MVSMRFLTGIDRDEFAHHLRYSVWIMYTIFQQKIGLTMTNDGHFKVIHQFGGDRVWSANHDLVHILEIWERIFFSSRPIVKLIILAFLIKIVDYFNLPCMRAHWELSRVYSLLDSWIPCTCSPLGRCVNPQSNSRRVSLLVPESPSVQRGTNQMHQPRKPVQYEIATLIYY